MAERWGRPVVDLLDMPAYALRLQFQYITQSMPKKEESDAALDEFTDDEIAIITGANDQVKSYGTS